MSLTDKGDIKLKNPLGPDTAYLRNNLKDSLISNIKSNPQEKGNIHFFEVSNIYTPRKADLPNEKLILGGVIKNGEYRNNKGIVETLLEELNIDYSTNLIDGKGYLPNQRLEIYSGKQKIGEYGNLENGEYYYELGVSELISAKKIERKYKEIAKYPPQVEDMTLQLSEKTYVGDVIATISNFQFPISKIEFVDIYENNFTFNIQYQSEDHTLTDKEVEEIRNKILSSLKSKFGIMVKE